MAGTAPEFEINSPKCDAVCNTPFMADGNPSKGLVFRFQKFDVHHERAAMKVGTDGVLLGAWAGQESPGGILDVGTGSGLIALMLAQRFPAATIHAIEIDAAAAGEARGNFQRSPWSDRLALIEGDVRELNLPNVYSLIVANPPWYDTEMQPPEKTRSHARHSESLPARDLIAAAAKYLADDGRFALILPMEKSERFISTATSAGLTMIRRSDVRPKPSKPVHRVLMEFMRHNADVSRGLTLGHLAIETEERHVYTAEFQHLVRDFYLRFG